MTNRDDIDDEPKQRCCALGSMSYLMHVRQNLSTCAFWFKGEPKLTNAAVSLLPSPASAAGAPASAGCAGTDGAPQPRHPHRTRPGTAGIDGRRWCWGWRLSRDDLVKHLVLHVRILVAACTPGRQPAAGRRGLERDGQARGVGRALGRARFEVRHLGRLADQSAGYPRATRLVVLGWCDWGWCGYGGGCGAWRW